MSFHHYHNLLEGENERVAKEIEGITTLRNPV
jgi:hypothetical protein